MSKPKHNYWVRCKDCDYLYLVEYKPTKLQKNQYSTHGCKVCYYRWLRKTTVDSMYNVLKKGFTMTKKRQFMDWDELAPVFFKIYRNSDPIFVRECFKEASLRLECHFNKIWERSFQ